MIVLDCLLSNISFWQHKCASKNELDGSKNITSHRDYKLLKTSVRKKIIYSSMLYATKVNKKPWKYLLTLFWGLPRYLMKGSWQTSPICLRRCKWRSKTCRSWPWRRPKPGLCCPPPSSRCSSVLPRKRRKSCTILCLGFGVSLQKNEKIKYLFFQRIFFPKCILCLQMASKFISRTASKNR